MKSPLTKRFAAPIFALLLIAFLAGCSGTSKPPVTLSSIAVTPANPTIAVTATEQFTATGTYSDNSTKDLTTQVTWASQTAGVATISAGGLATPVPAVGGSTIITATLGTVTGMTKLTVTVPTLMSIAVTPANPTISLSATEQFTATGTYSDNSTKNLTTQVTWASQTLTVATISAGGLATPVAGAGGTSTITATLGTVTGMTVLTVTAPPTLTSIAVTPANPTISVNLTEQFTATGTYSDNSTKNLTTQVTWVSQTPAVATISAAGLATPVPAVGGSTIITATLGTVTGMTKLTVTVPTLTAIAVTPTNPTIGIGATQQFVATGTYSDTTTKVLTTQVTWASQTPATATISAGGLATAVATGTSNITATLGAVVSNAAVLTVSPATLQSILISPLTPQTIIVGGTEDYTAVGVYSDNSQHPLVGLTWSFTTTATTPPISLGSANGIALGLAPGTAKIIASSAGLTANVQLTVVAASSRFAYLANGFDGTISAYAVNAPGQTFTPLGYVADTGNSGFPTDVLLEPSGRFAYALNGFANTNPGIMIYNVNPVTGALSPVTTVGVTNPVLNQGQFPVQGVIDPTGQFMYVANLNQNSTYSVTDYTIDTVTGGLTPIDAPVTTNINTPTIVMDRAGKFLYVINDGTNLIAEYSIAASTSPTPGSLTPLPAPNATIPTGNFPELGTFDPTNTYFYVPNDGDDTVSVYTIAGSGSATPGALTPVAGSPFIVGPGGVNPNGPFGVAVDPSSKFLYVANNAADTVSAFSIGTGGAIGAALAGSPYFTSPTGALIGAAPFSINIDPEGTFVDIVNQTSGTIAIFKLNSDGTLTATSTVEARLSPQFLNLYPGPASPTLAPAAVFATNSTAGSISAFTVTPSTGALVAASPATGVTNNSFATTDITGQFFYATSNSPNDLLGLSVTQATAGLTGFTGSPFSLGGATSSVVPEPSDRFVYTALTGAAGSVLGYATGSNTLTTFTAGTVAVANLNAIVEDPQGLSLYGLGTGFIVPIFISPIDGALGPGTSVAFAGTNWTLGGVDPSGQYLLAIDSASNTLQSFSIGQIPTVSTLNKTGSVSTGGTSPAGLAIDPLDRFVFVTDATAKNVTTFSISPLTGAVAVAGPPATPVTLAGVPTQAVVDATGTYLYVAFEGTPVTNPGSVAVFTIGSTGTLTPVTGSPFAAGVGTKGVAVSNSVQ
jgi:6-phosphogluconolactonase (cycloisomerase 2 family)